MGETLTFIFRCREPGKFEIELKESWSGKTVRGGFSPPYTTRQTNLLLKRLGRMDNSEQELRAIGYSLFLALCGGTLSKTGSVSVPHEYELQEVFHTVIQRTLRRRGTVALSFHFDPGCDEFARYPWELLHNGDHFLLVSGLFTLTRALLRPDLPLGCELPIYPPMRVLYIGASPLDCAPLETEQSYEALEQAFSPLIETGQVFLDRLEPPTFDQLVRYLSIYGGAGLLSDKDTTIPCYVVHFDGHGAYGRLCPKEECGTINDPDARKCSECNTSLIREKPQTYLCFCDDQGMKRFIDTQSLRGLFVTSDVRLAVFSACETATISSGEKSAASASRLVAVDATLATALVTAQVPAVVAMPFSLQDNISPTFMFHFYESLAEGRTLEEALARSRQALLPMQQSWFIPVLYRHVVEGQEGAIPLLASRDESDQHLLLSHFSLPVSFVGREVELRELEGLLAASALLGNTGSYAVTRTRSVHHFVLTGPPGMGKTTLALEAIRRNQDKFPGGVIGIPLQAQKSFADALRDMLGLLRVPQRLSASSDLKSLERLVIGTLRSLASRELPVLLFIDGLETIEERDEYDQWLHFCCSLPLEVTVVATSHTNPETLQVGEQINCRWYEYRVSKMREEDILLLANELAAASGLDQHIHLSMPEQQEVLNDICHLLDGYPLGIDFLFGPARSFAGKIYKPEAATRSLEEIRDDLQIMPLAGVQDVIGSVYKRLSPVAQKLLSCLSSFSTSFSREEIQRLLSDRQQLDLQANWREARDELVYASLMGFNGRLYSVHAQVRAVALAYLPEDERIQLLKEQLKK